MKKHLFNQAHCGFVEYEKGIIKWPAPEVPAFKPGLSQPLQHFTWQMMCVELFVSPVILSDLLSFCFLCELF